MTAFPSHVLTADVVHVDGRICEPRLVFIGSLIQFAPIWIMQHVFCRQAEPELTYAPDQSLAQSYMVRLW